MFFLSGAFIVITTAIVGSKKSTLEELVLSAFDFKISLDLGASFYLAITSAVLSLTAGFFLYKFDPRSETDVSKSSGGETV